MLPRWMLGGVVVDPPLASLPIADDAVVVCFLKVLTSKAGACSGQMCSRTWGAVIYKFMDVSSWIGYNSPPPC